MGGTPVATTQPLLPLEQFYWREKQHPERRYLIQPQAGGQVEELTWGQVGEQARRAAAWLRQLDLAPGSNIAIISKNCAHWIIADLAIWMAGHISVPLYPNRPAESVRQILEHPGAMAGQSSSLPMKASAVPECSRIWRTDSAVRLGYSGTAESVRQILEHSGTAL